MFYQSTSFLPSKVKTPYGIKLDEELPALKNRIILPFLKVIILPFLKCLIKIHFT